MKSNSFWRSSIPIIVAVWTLTSQASAQTITPKPPPDCIHSITQSFPTNPSGTNTQVTTWTICWKEVLPGDSNNPQGLVIGPVFFQKSQSSTSVLVLYDMRISEIFVPYHDGQRFYDISGFNFGLAPLTPADCPASVGGTLVSADVCKEVHDRGLMWKDSNSPAVRRGEELKLWGAFLASNYYYIEEYTFRDGGVIIGRLGATGQNLPNSEHTPHAHNALWRIDIDLDGVTNSAEHLQHMEDISNSNGTANDVNLTIPNEVGFTWDERLHDMLEISNASFRNAQMHLSTYHLIPLVTGGGLTQHYELFTQNDFWVTLYDRTQFQARFLDTYVSGHRAIQNADIVAWFKGSLHHHPRDEDGVGTNFTGVTHTMWTGFMLMPNDLFDCSPFFHPTCP